MRPCNCLSYLNTSNVINKLSASKSPNTECTDLNTSNVINKPGATITTQGGFYKFKYIKCY